MVVSRAVPKVRPVVVAYRIRSPRGLIKMPRLNGDQEAPEPLQQVSLVEPRGGDAIGALTSAMARLAHAMTPGHGGQPTSAPFLESVHHAA